MHMDEMKSRHKEKGTGPRLRTEQILEPPGIEKHREESRTIKNSFWISLAITFVLLGLKTWVENSDVGRLFEQMTYDLLQLRLSSSLRAQDIPIVLDISSIPLDSSQKSPNASPLTRRQPIEDLVEAL